MPDAQKVLLIEQDTILRRQYRDQISRSHDVITAASAQAAIDALDINDAKIDLIVMDVNVDNNNGVELIHELKSYDDWLSIPIVILSSIPISRFPKTVFSRYGVENFLYKPATTPADLMTAVNRVLRTAREPSHEAS